MKALRGIEDPEKKRKMIGAVFIKVFAREAKKLGRVPFLAQGTLYPDVIVLDLRLPDDGEDGLGVDQGGRSTEIVHASIHKAGNLAWSKDCPGCKSYKAPHVGCDSKKMMACWFATYPGVRAFMDDRRAHALKTGLAYGMWGMEWTLPGAWSPHEEVREQTLRQAHALPVQEGAQRLIKLAMAAVYQQLPANGSVRPILQIHDSLLFVVLNRMVEKWHRTVKSTMEGIVTWKVPIVADGKVGPNWLALEKLA